MTATSTLRRAAALAAAALLLAGCTSAAESGAGESACPVTPDESITTTARIAYQAIPNGDLVVKDLGWLEACLPNATIEWARYAGAEVVQALGSDSADLGLMGSSSLVRALSAPLELDLQVTWIFDVIGDAEALVVSGDQTSITDLAGASIAVPFATTTHYSLLAALEDAGMDATTDVTLINLNPDAMPAAWENGEIDAAWVWEPTLSELTASGTVILTSAQTAELGRPTFDLGGATSEFIEANPEFMVMWTRVQSAAAALLQEDPEAAAESIAVELGLTPEEVQAQIAGYRYLTADEQAGADYFGGGLADAMVHTAEFLATQDQVEAASSAEEYAAAVHSASIEQAAG